MRLFHLVLLLGLLAAGRVVQGVPPGAEPGDAQPVIVRLSDGSRIVGATPLGSWSIDSALVGSLKIPSDRIRSLKLKPDHQTAAVVLRNGDKIEGTLSVAEIRLRTSFGPVSIPRQFVQELQFTESGGGAPSEGLVLYFALDDSDVEMIHDRGPGQLKAALNGAKPADGAYRFDGDSDHIAVPFHNSYAFGPNDPFTVSAWVQPVPHAGRFQAIVVTAQPDAGYEWEWGLYVDRENRFMSGWEEHAVVQSKTVVQPEHWYHVAATYRDGDWVLYVDGAQESTAHAPRTLETRGGLAIGRKGQSTDLADSYHGLIRDVRVYKRALSADEITQLRDATAPAGR